MTGGWGKKRWVAGISLADGTGHAALLERTGSGLHLKRCASREWDEEDDLGTVRALLAEVAPGLRPSRARLAFLLADGPMTVEVKTFPRMSGDDFQRAAEWHQKSNRRTRIEEPCFASWLQVGESERNPDGEIEGVLLETDRALVDRLVELGRGAGFSGAIVVPHPFAISALAEHHLPGGETALVLSGEESESFLTAVSGGRLLLHRTVDLSPDPMDGAIDDPIGGSADGPAGGAVGLLARERTSLSTGKLRTELERTTHYLESRFGISPSRLLLPVPDEKKEGVVREATDLPSGVLAEGVSSDTEWNSAILFAYGAAVRAAAGTAAGVLPVPKKKKLGRSVLPRLPRFPLKKVVGLAVPLLSLQLALMLAGRVVIDRRNGEMQTKLEALGREAVDPELERRLARWESQALILNRIRSSQVLWSVLFRELSANLPEGVVVDEVEGHAPRNEKLSLEDLDPGLPEIDSELWEIEEEEDEDEKPALFTVRGKAPGLPDLRTMVERLEKAPGFGKVTLSAAESTGEEGSSRSGPVRFELLCEPRAERRMEGDEPDRS